MIQTIDVCPPSKFLLKIICLKFHMTQHVNVMTISYILLYVISYDQGVISVSGWSPGDFMV